MSKRRLPPKERQKDLDAYAALDAIGDYTPANPAYAKVKAKAAKDAMQGLQTTELQSKAKYEGDRDNAVDGEWAFHEMMLGVDTQVIAQYGKDSNEVQSLGLKKKSEYKKGGKKTPKPTP